MVDLLTRKCIQAAVVLCVQHNHTHNVHANHQSLSIDTSFFCKGTLLFKRLHYTRLLHNKDTQSRSRVRNKRNTGRRITYQIEQMQNVYFFDKEDILISRRYQLHPASATTYCPIDNTDAHSQNKKKKNYEKKKSRYSELFLVAAVLTQPIQHQKSSFSKRDASKKVARSKILGFYPGKSSRSQNNVFSKTIVRHNQLRPDIGFSPCKVEL
jgi:hypothetical protein